MRGADYGCILYLCEYPYGDRGRIESASFGMGSDTKALGGITVVLIKEQRASIVLSCIHVFCDVNSNMISEVSRAIDLHPSALRLHVASLGKSFKRVAALP